MSEFGEALAHYRNEAGLNQREVGAAIGLDSTQVNKIERGHRPPLGAKYMKPLVRVLRLNQNEALNLVKLAGHSPKVLEDEVQAPVHPRIRRKAVGQPTQKASRGGSPHHSRVSRPGSKRRTSSTPMSTMANPALAPPDLPLGTTGEEIESLIAAAGLSEDEEEEIGATLFEITKLLLRPYLARIEKENEGLDNEP